MKAALREALVLVRAGGRRSLLAGAGVLLAATMLGTAVTVSWSLATGFDRSVKAADLPDVIARFDRERVGEIEEDSPRRRAEPLGAGRVAIALPDTREIGSAVGGAWCGRRKIGFAVAGARYVRRGIADPLRVDRCRRASHERGDDRDGAEAFH